MKNYWKWAGKREVWPGNGMKLMRGERNGACIRFLCWAVVGETGRAKWSQGGVQRNGMNRATLHVRYNPAYERNERT